jgi:predicted AlkP superfamily phosphohydrolase/phosphomutase
MGLFDRLRGGDDERVAFVGIDGVPYSLITDHPDEFDNLAALAREGTAGEIDSIVPPESSACWPALTTGRNPGETGVYGFQDRKSDSYETYVPMGSHVQCDRLWDRVAESGRDATVMNVPVTFPPQRNVQRMVSGFLTPGGVDRGALPDEFADDLASMDYRIDVDSGLGHHDDKSEFIEDAHETLDRRMEAFRTYVGKGDWDLFFGVFMTTDRVNHFLFGDYVNDGEYKEEFMEFYAKVDDYIGELRGMLGDDVTMVVASDHGFTYQDYEVNLNTWLEEEGWLSYRDRYDVYLNRWLAEQGYLAGDDADGPRGLDPETVAFSPESGEVALNAAGQAPPGDLDDDPEAVIEELETALSELTAPDGTDLVAAVRVPDSTGSDAGPDLVLEPVDDDDRVVAFHDDFEGLDDDDAEWLERGHRNLGDITSDTRAYSFTPGRLYLNLERREPRGSVPEDDYESVRDELREALETLEGPDGRPVAKRVVDGETAFRGAHDEIAPDLVVIPNHGFDLKGTFKQKEGVFTEGPRNGMHSFENTALFVDDPDARIGDADLFDIAPTILDLLDVDFERTDFDGASLV